MGEVVLCFGPAGCGKTGLALRRCTETLSALRPRDLLWESRPRVLFLAADARQARTVRSALLSEPSLPGLTGPVVLTFRGLYEVIFGLASVPVPPVLSDVARLALLRRVLQDLSAEGGLTVFGSAREETDGGPDAPIYTRPGFVIALDGFLQELKQGAKEPRHFSRALDSFGRDDRSRDLEAVYERYQNHLTEHGLYDAAGLSWHARDLLDEAKDGFSSVRLLVVDGFVTFTPTQMSVLKQLSEWAEATLVTLTYEEDPQRNELYHLPGRTYRLLREELRAKPRPVPPAPDRRASLSHVERNVFRWEGIEPIEPDVEQIRILEAAGDRREALEVAREVKRLISDGYCRAQAVLVLCRSLLRHGPLLADAFTRLGVPVRMGAHLSLLHVPVVSVFLKVLRLSAEDWPRGLASDVLSSPYLTAAAPEGEGEVDVESLAARAFIIGGREQWSSRLQRLHTSLTEVGADPGNVESAPEQVRAERSRSEQDVRDCAIVLKRVTALATALEVLPAEGPLADFTGAAVELLSRLGLHEAAAAGEGAETCRDLVALDQLGEVLTELAESEPTSRTRMSRAEFVTELHLALSQTLLKERPGSAEAASVLEVYEARGLNAPVVFVVGLVEGVFPTGVSTRPFYAEAERRRLNESGLGLQQQEDAQRREMLLFYTAATRATRRLYLTYPATDSRGKSQLRSHFVDEVEELFSDTKRCRRSIRLSNWPPRLEEAAAEDELLESWVTAAAERPGRLSGECAAAIEPLADDGARTLTAVCAAAAQLREREGMNPLGAYDGILAGERVAPLLAREFGAGRMYSASQFDQYARCPFRFFLSYLLGLTPPEAPSERMEPVNVGVICHQALACVHRRSAADGLTVWDDTQATERLLDEELDRLFSDELIERLGLTRALADVYQEEARQMLLAVLRQHPEAEGFGDLIPRHFEVSFGGAAEAGVDQVSCNAPLTLTVGGERVLVRGRIDRVDVSPGEPTQYGVLDYKLGRGSTASNIRNGQHTQLLLYVAACEELLFPGADCEVAGFLSLSRGELVQPIRTTPPPQRKTQWMTPEEARQLLSHYLATYIQDLRKGLFPPMPVNAQACSTCPFATCCRPEPARMERKLGPGRREGLLGLEPLDARGDAS